MCTCDVENEVQGGNDVRVGNCIMMPNGLPLVMEELPLPQTIFMSSSNSKERCLGKNGHELVVISYVDF